MYKNENEMPVLLLKELKKKNLSLSVAESCTGGLFSKLLTDIDGASKSFIGGIIAYNNSVKENLLAVSEKTLLEDGAVSPKCAEEMSLGLKKIMNADITLSFTGIAGPGGGSAEKEVGLVYSHIIYKSKHFPFKFNIKGDRDFVRNRVVLKIFYELLKILKDESKKDLVNYYDKRPLTHENRL
jgi:nicotinamide-nucleotide amidase